MLSGKQAKYLIPSVPTTCDGGSWLCDGRLLAALVCREPITLNAGAAWQRRPCNHRAVTDLVVLCSAVRAPMISTAVHKVSFVRGIAGWVAFDAVWRCGHRALQYFHKVIEQEITLIANGGGDQPSLAFQAA